MNPFINFGGKRQGELTTNKHGAYETMRNTLRNALASPEEFDLQQDDRDRLENFYKMIKRYYDAK